MPELAVLESMNSPHIQFVISSRRMSMYEPLHQISTWGENFKSNVNMTASVSMIGEIDMKFDNQSENASQKTQEPPHKFDKEAIRRIDKIQRRLAQNREAARKSRLRKKAYVRQLETSRLQLIELEQKLERARHQPGLYLSNGQDANNLGFAGSENPGVTTFKMKYGLWVEEQNRQTCELRNCLDSHLGDAKLRVLVESIMNHYYKLFGMKSTAAKADVFNVMSGMWKTTAEWFFLWIGGFRPSELLKVLMPQMDTLTDEQLLDVCTLKQSCEQAEDALSQGMDKLQQTLSEIVAVTQMVGATYTPQIAIAMGKLEALASFVNQADHLRKETMQQMQRILTVRQAAKCLLALGEYSQRLRELSSLWADRPHELV